MKTVARLSILTSFLTLFVLSYAQDIFIASYNGDFETVKKLINQNPGLVNSKNSFGRFPLEMAASTGQVEIVRFLLEHGADVRMNRNGATALHMAARNGHRNIVELFLRIGADANATTKEGKTPLHYAKDRGHDDVVALLKKSGADDSEWTFPKLAGKYLDQSPPGETPAIFAPGIVSAQEHFEHSSLAFSPDFEEVYWSTDFTEFGFYDIVFMKKENGRWSAPKLAPFSEKAHAGDPVFSYDGRKFYFSSTRPRDSNAGKSDENIWVVEKTGPRWSEPKPLDGRINTDKGESILSVSRQGTLYFRRDMELLQSSQKNGVFEAPEKLELPLDSKLRVLALFSAPDESYLIIEVIGEGGHGGADLYICYKMEDGSWSEPTNLGPKINTGGHERFPSVAPDGKYLVFLRVTDDSDIYWVDARIINDLKPTISPFSPRSLFPGGIEQCRLLFRPGLF